MIKPITVIVIAGGKSTRMGENKALLKLGGKRMIDIAIGLAEKLTSNILISTNNSLGITKYPEIADVVSNIGPMGGIYSCMQQVKTPGAIVIPCDTPFVNLDLLKNIMASAGEYDAVIPEQRDGKLEPLVAYYSSQIMPQLEQQIRAKDYKMVKLLELIRVNYLQVQKEALFQNINTKADLQRWNDQIF